MKQYLILVISCLVLSACNKWGMDTEWKSGKFRLIAVDTITQMSLIHEDSSISLVGPTIFAVGADDKYIVVKQHPALDEFASSFDKTITNYFIITRDKNLRGPLKKEEFETLSTSLSLPPFTKVFDELQ